MIGGEETINCGNSFSYRFPINGLAGRDRTLEIFMTAEPINVHPRLVPLDGQRVGPSTKTGREALDIVLGGSSSIVGMSRTWRGPNAPALKRG